MRVLFYAANGVATLWMWFLVFMYTITWPFGFLGYPPMYLDPMIGPWIRGIWFAGGAFIWLMIIITGMKRFLEGGFDVSIATSRVIEVIFTAAWAIAAVVYLLMIISAG